MANRLLRYEWYLFRRSFADAFSRWRDKALLLVILVLAAFWVREQFRGADAVELPSGAIWLALLAAPTGFGWSRLVKGRLNWLAGESALAAPALEARTRFSYLATAHLLVAFPLLAAAAMLGLSGPPLAAVAFASGAGLASIPRSAADAHVEESVPPASVALRQPALRAVLGSQIRGGGDPARTAALLVVANFTLTFLAACLSREQPDALRFAAILAPPLVALLIAGRADPTLLGFLPYAGYGPGFVAFAVSALPSAGLAASTVAVTLAGPEHWPAMLGVLLLLHLPFILIGIAHAWLYPGRSGRSVDFQVQTEFLGLVLIALLLPPLAMAALAWRLWVLRRHHAGLVWLHP